MSVHTYSSADGHHNSENEISVNEICSSLGEFEIHFFDKRLSLETWGKSKMELKAACDQWEKNKQDQAAIENLTAKRDEFLRQTIGMPDQMLKAAVAILGPARDQGRVTNCFANSVADLVGHKIGKKVSSFSVQVRTALAADSLELRNLWRLWNRPNSKESFKEKAESRFTNGEYLPDAMRAAPEGVLCEEDQPGGAQKYSDQDLYYFWEYYEKGLRTYSGLSPPSNYMREITRILNVIAPSLDAKDFIVHAIPTRPTSTVALGSWLDRQCNLRLKSSGYYGEGTAPIDNIRLGLRKKVPIVVYYDVSLILEKAKGGHTSIVLGETKFRGRSRFLVRNSWGKYCGSPYKKVYQAACKDGHFWITEDELKKGFIRAYFFQ